MNRCTRVRRGSSLVLTALAALVAMLALGVTGAAAATATATFVYNGSDNDQRLILDSGLRYVDGCIIGDDPVTCFPDDFPGTAWFRVRAGVKSTVVTAQSADFTLDSPDTFRQDASSTLTTTLKAVDATGKEVIVRTTPFVNFDIAYDAPLANCPKNTIETIDDLENADTSGCLNVVYHSGDVDITTFTLLEKDTTLPYGGTRSLSQTSSSPELDIGALAGLPPDLLEVRLDFETVLELAANMGYQATRSLAGSSDPGATLFSGGINWPDANPLDDSFKLPCSVQVGDNLIYKLTDNRWAGDGVVTGTPKLVIVIAVLPDIDIPIGGGITLFDAPVLATAEDYTKTLGEILAENKKPTVAVVPPGPGNEGSQIAFSVVGTGPGGALDNCDGSLNFHWLFDDGSEAFGQNVQHAFPDNNGLQVRTGHVVVTDDAGNVTDVDFSVLVHNVDPTVDAGPDKTKDWGVPVSFHANGGDKGSIDLQSLTYAWDYDDPLDPVGDAGQDVSHTFAAPGSYDVEVTVEDKDGATGSDTVGVSVTKRDTTLGYTGPLSSGPSKTITLQAHLVDEYGQPVVGRKVDFSLGNQSAVGTTDSSGSASVDIKLSQKPGTYPLSATFSADGKYNGASDAPLTFQIGNK